MKITHTAPDAITPYDKNPRLNDNAVDAVARSIEEFGFRQPVVVDEQSVIIVGHTRWKAATKLGLGRIPVHVAEGLSPEKAKAYRIADNATNALADWDLDLLPTELTELKDLGLDLDLFGGSGSTLIAAEQQGRKAYLMEIDPAYCDVIVERWEQFTNGKTERVPANAATTEKAPADAGAGKSG